MHIIDMPIGVKKIRYVGYDIIDVSSFLISDKI